MMQIYLLFACGLTLSAIAAFYAITGLVAIFATAPLAIVLMGSSLEATKLVIASWLYNNWREIPKTFKAYFSVALVILMMLTSMGIFGYLSKAHLDQAVPTGDVVSKLVIVDEKIKQEKDIIDAARKTLQQLDSQVEQTVARSDSTQGVERSLQIRRGQQKERSALLAEVGSAQTRISRLNEERAPIAAEVRKVEAEVGPLKYIAALIYGTDTLDETILEKAVRIVIIMIVVVFDPLAVITLLAANYSLRRLRNDTRKETTDQGERISEQEQSSSEIPSKEYTFPSTFWFKTEEEITVPEVAKPKPKSRSKSPRASTDSDSGWLESQRAKPKPLPTDFLTKVKEGVQPEMKPVKESLDVNGWQYTSYTQPEDPTWKESNPLNDPTGKASKTKK